MASARSERTILLLVAAVQFVNLLDVMMVMPLGPDLAAALGIPLSDLGLVGGSYTAAAALSGVAGAFFLDRFDRRSALAVAMLGLVVATAAGGLATGLSTLLAARVLAGAFGGPAAAISLSIVADVIPPERRGKAMGVVMGAYSFAAVLGVPAGLELARRGGFQVPFFAVAGLGVLVAGLATALLPSMRGHIGGAAAPGSALRELRALLGRPLVARSYLATTALMMASFLIIPNISAYVQNNLGYPRERLGLLYLAGGALSFVVMRTAGPLLDRLGAFRTSLSGAALLVAVLYAGFHAYVPGLPVLAVFVGFMTGTTICNISYSTLASKVPLPSERARFASMQSAVQHLASALAAFVSARMLRELPDGRLDGMGGVAALAIACALVFCPLLLWIERRVALAGRAGPALAARPAGSLSRPPRP
ncbi:MULTISPECIES: MFS transporter [Sorangium]|uniref:MFS transporter n=1 Tax=Sorangium cellulosum TaxID=56 RepID=A0A4P2QRV3_SORCE|nr:MULTISPECIES: MFS transporter [Sorangium]AUX32778.1 MFS transporter [Sorangium cellulosum]WCQ92154.1 Purine ribonucleoside efflux pump NepI [Sorangium sp. Soce836]